MRSKSIFVSVVMVLFIVTTGTLQASLVGYVSRTDHINSATTQSYPDELYLTDLDSGSQTLIEINGISSGIASLALSPNTKELYAAADRNLYKIDVLSGTASYIGHIDRSNLSDLAFAPDGSLYSTVWTGSASPGGLGGELIRINTETAAVTSVGTIFENFTGFAVEWKNYSFAINQNGEGFGWGFDGHDRRFATININDASGTFVGGYTPDYDFTDFDFGPEGILYGLSHFWDSGNNNILYSIDTDSLTVTALRDLEFGGYGFAIVPEPATLILLGLGAMIIRRKR